MNKIYRILNIPSVTLVLIGVQVMAYFMIMQGSLDASGIDLRASKILEGEFWRLGTFVVLPPTSHFLFAIFAWMLFYLFGSSLENFWGAGKYNAFLLTGFIVSIAVAFIVPDQAFGNMFVMTAVFLAFAFYNPDFEILLFFILPVKIKWLALLTWLAFVYVMFTGSGSEQLNILATTSNYFLFLGADLYRKIRGRNRAVVAHIKESKAAKIAFHTCIVCGKTDKTHPEMKFRYCNLCAGSPGYCVDHMQNHEHLENESESATEKE